MGRFRPDGFERVDGELRRIDALHSCDAPHQTRVDAGGSPVRCTRRKGHAKRHANRAVKVWWTLAGENVAPVVEVIPSVDGPLAPLLPGRRLRVLDLFSGLEGWSKPFRARGHDVVTLDYNPAFKADLVMDIREFAKDPIPYLEQVRGPGWRPDVVLLSPDCRGFSILTVMHNWVQVGRRWVPKQGSVAELGIELLRAAVRVIEVVQPRFWVMENPRAMMRNLPELRGFDRRTVTYCQYGMRWQKPTDLWGVFPPALRLKETCNSGDPCHDAAPRGSGMGIAGVKGKWAAAERAVIPPALALSLCLACEAGGAPRKGAVLESFGVTA